VENNNLQSNSFGVMLQKVAKFHVQPIEEKRRRGGEEGPVDEVKRSRFGERRRPPAGPRRRKPKRKPVDDREKQKMRGKARKVRIGRLSEWREEGLRPGERPSRINLYERIYRIVDENIKSCKEYGPSVIKRRLGSMSEYGQVFLVEIDGTESALKIMPDTSPMSLEGNLTEIEMSTMASSLVRNGKSQYFPLLYDAGFCDNLHMDTESPDPYFLRDKSRFFKIYTAMVSNLVKPKYTSDVFGKFTRTDRIYSLLQQLKELMTAQPSWFKEEALASNVIQMKLSLDQEFVGAYMLLELALGDVYTVFEAMSEEEAYRVLPAFIGRVFEAISDMQKHMKIYHHDLHPGNILVQRTASGEYIPLINDFGFAEPLTRENDKFDAIAVINFFSDATTGPLKDKLKEILKVAETSPIERVIEDWKWKSQRVFTEKHIGLSEKKIWLKGLEEALPSSY
jgi:hypothetical protein